MVEDGRYRHSSRRLSRRQIRESFRGHARIQRTNRGVPRCQRSIPSKAGRWWMPGQKEGEPPLPAPIYGFHGPAVIDGDRAYLGYSPAIVILDISDISKPKLIGQLTVSPPFGTNIPVHDVMPIPGRNLLFAHAEGTGGGDSPTGGGLPGRAIPDGLGGHSRSGQAETHFPVSHAGSSRGRAVQGFLRKGRPLRPAQHEYPAAQLMWKNRAT